MHPDTPPAPRRSFTRHTPGPGSATHQTGPDAALTAQHARTALQILHTLPRGQQDLLWKRHVEGWSDRRLQEFEGIEPHVLGARIVEADHAYAAACMVCDAGELPLGVLGPLMKAARAAGRRRRHAVVGMVGVAAALVGAYFTVPLQAAPNNDTAARTAGPAVTAPDVAPTSTPTHGTNTTTRHPSGTHTNPARPHTGSTYDHTVPQPGTTPSATSPAVQPPPPPPNPGGQPSDPGGGIAGGCGSPTATPSGKPTPTPTPTPSGTPCQTLLQTPPPALGGGPAGSPQPNDSSSDPVVEAPVALPTSP